MGKKIIVVFSLVAMIAGSPKLMAADSEVALANEFLEVLVRYERPANEGGMVQLERAIHRTIENGTFRKQGLRWIIGVYYEAMRESDYELGNEIIKILESYHPPLAEQVVWEYQHSGLRNSGFHFLKVMDPGETSHGEAMKQLPNAYGFAGRAIEKTFNDAHRNYPALTNGALAAGAAAASAGVSAAGQAIIWGAATALGIRDPGPSKPLTLDVPSKKE